MDATAMRSGAASGCRPAARRHCIQASAMCRPQPTRPLPRQPLAFMDAHRRRVARARAEPSSSAQVEAASSASAGEGVAAAEEATGSSDSDSTEQCITVTLKKPLGVVFKEGQGGRVEIETIKPGGNAAEDGTLKEGDVIRKVSAYVLAEGKSGEYAKRGHGARPFENYNRIMFEADGEDFDTVMAAIGSNNERWGILDLTLEMSRA